MNPPTVDYTKDELLTVRAAHAIADAEVVFVGIGLPNRAANLAKLTHAPNVQLLYESGIYGSMPDRWPESIGDSCLVVNSLAVQSMAELFLFYLQRGHVDVGFLGAAQIDRFGNLNTTVVGDYRQPTTRLPGSGGACDIAALSKRLVVTLPLSLRTFPERLDFVTSPGGRSRDGLQRNAGPPMTVITDLAVFKFDDESGEMELQSLQPGATLQEVQRHMGWRPRIAQHLDAAAEPTVEELALMRRMTARRAG